MRVRLKDVVTANRSVLSDSTDPEFAFHYIDIGAVSDGQINVPEEISRFETAPSRARRLAEPGDTVVSTVRTYLRAVARVPESPAKMVFSTGFAVLHPSKEWMDSRFLSYFCTSDYFIESVVSRSVGVSYPAINASEVANIWLDLPPLDEQRRIADFLDAETSAIDRLASLRVRQVGGVDDRAQAELDRLFAAPSFSRVRLKFLLRQRISYGVLVPRFVDGDGVRMIRVNDLVDLPQRAPSLAQIERAQSAEYRRTVVESGDLLISVVGTVGRSAVVPPEAAGANLARAVARLCPLPEVDAELLWCWTQSSRFRQQVDLVTGGDTAQPTLNVGDLANFELALPVGAAERSDLLREASRVLATRSGVRAACERQASLIAERRQALITAAVTGRLDVTTARRGAD